MPPDLVKLSALVEPLLVRLSRFSNTWAMAESAGTAAEISEPIFVPSFGSSGDLGWTKDDIANLEAWTWDKVGGGAYRAYVVDAHGTGLEWRFSIPGERKQSLIGLYKDAMHVHETNNWAHARPGGSANERGNDAALPTWEVNPVDGWTWLELFGSAVQICHAHPPLQRMWIVYIYCGQVADGERRGVLLDNAHCGYVTEDEAKRAALEYLIPTLQRDLVAIDGLLEQLPQGGR